MFSYQYYFQFLSNCSIITFMKYTIEEIKENQNNTYLVNTSNVSTKDLKNALSNGQQIELGFDFLNLGTKLYGNNKKESIAIQKENCKKVQNSFKTISKIARIARNKKYNFNNTFCVKNLNEKKNNNDYLIVSMLELKFKTIFLKRLSKSILYTCEYLDRENALHNMCDFHDNRCAKHRARGFERSTGCCPVSCKFQDHCPCKTKNLSCKLIMCDYLENMGYYFTPHTIPILVRHMNPLERIASTGMFFKSTKRTFLFMWIVRLLIIFFIFLASYSILSIFI